jgi:hypothetical protein
MIVISDACTINIINECNYTSRIASEDPRVMLQIVASLTDDTRSIIVICLWHRPQYWITVVAIFANGNILLL